MLVDSTTLPRSKSMRHVKWSWEIIPIQENTLTRRRLLSLNSSQPILLTPSLKDWLYLWDGGPLPIGGCIRIGTASECRTSRISPTVWVTLSLWLPTNAHIDIYIPLCQRSNKTNNTYSWHNKPRKLYLNMPHLDEYNFSAPAELHSFSALVSANILFSVGPREEIRIYQKWSLMWPNDRVSAKWGLPIDILWLDSQLFDMDGTIIDSTNAIIKHWHQIGKEIGVDPEVILATSHGRRSIDVLEILEPKLANWECT